MATLTKTVTLNPSQSQQVSFQVVPTEAGLYQVSVNGLTGSFRATAAPPLGEGQKYIEVTDLKWAENPPFIGGGICRYDITLKNLWSEPTKATVGLWKEPWWSEGGWQHFELEGFEEKTFHGAAKTPAEQGSYWAYLKLFAFEKVYYLFDWGLVQQVVQNPDAIIPAGSPSTYPNWSGLKNFPVPYSPYQPGIYIESIKLPMLSRSHTTEGELVMRLLSPSDNDQWQAPVGDWSVTEQRYGLVSIKYSPATTYWYSIIIEGAKAASIVLGQDDPSGLYTIPLTFGKTNKPIGSQQPVTFKVHLFPDDKSYVLFWSPEIRRLHLYCLLGYVNVGA